MFLLKHLWSHTSQRKDEHGGACLKDYKTYTTIIRPVTSLTFCDTFPLRFSSIFYAAFGSIKSCFTCITSRPKNFKCSGLWLAKSISSNLRVWAQTKTQSTHGNEHMKSYMRWILRQGTQSIAALQTSWRSPGTPNILDKWYSIVWIMNRINARPVNVWKIQWTCVN